MAIFKVENFWSASWTLADKSRRGLNRVVQSFPLHSKGGWGKISNISTSASLHNPKISSNFQIFLEPCIRVPQSHNPKAYYWSEIPLKSTALQWGKMVAWTLKNHLSLQIRNSPSKNPSAFTIALPSCHQGGITPQWNDLGLLRGL